MVVLACFSKLYQNGSTRTLLLATALNLDTPCGRKILSCPLCRNTRCQTAKKRSLDTRVEFGFRALWFRGVCASGCVMGVVHRVVGTILTTAP
eukprot:5661853-Pleurochrysis_carterae.AAC.1